jgi:hypothetical protein
MLIGKMDLANINGVETGKSWAMRDDGRRICLSKDMHHINCSELHTNDHEQHGSFKDSSNSRYLRPTIILNFSKCEIHQFLILF